MLKKNGKLSNLSELASMPEKCGVDVAKVLGKSGEELFRELLRIHSVAEPADYYNVFNDQWLSEMMRVDYVLLHAHREHTGMNNMNMPELPDVKDVIIPELPWAMLAVQPSGASVPWEQAVIEPPVVEKMLLPAPAIAHAVRRGTVKNGGAPA